MKAWNRWNPCFGMKSSETRFSCEDGHGAELPNSVFRPTIQVPSTWGSEIHRFGVQPEADFELVPRLIGRKGNRLSFAGGGVSNCLFAWKTQEHPLRLDLGSFWIADQRFRYAHFGRCIQNWHSRIANSWSQHLEAATFAPSPSLVEALRVALFTPWELLARLRMFLKTWNHGLQVGNVHISYIYIRTYIYIYIC